MFILDTDHISLFQRNDPHVSARVLATPPQELVTTVITVEEQLRGRLDRVRRARSDEEVLRSYHNLLATSLYFRTITIISFDEQAQTIFKHLRAQGIRIGTQDIRIATIALSRGATLVTRNVQDFIMIPSLGMEDWSLPGEHLTTNERGLPRS
jgi:tRNA(fMet)-specific endonuclease VapC